MQIGQNASADKPASAPLAEPITVAKWWKNRRRNESVHVTLSEYEGRAIVSVRVYSTGTDGIDRPSPKGISMAVDKLPTLAQALVKAEAKARELGLIGAPTTEERARA
jgi:hypothetical protein